MGIGEINVNTKGDRMKIIEYTSERNILVEFQDEFKYVTRTTYNLFKRGKIKNPYSRTVYGIGYLGEGKYKAIKGSNSRYDTWRSMIKRCYSEKEHMEHSSYKNCTVSEEWHNFQNFAKWYDENYYEVEGERVCLDKDILVKGNKVYSPNTCVFAPYRINGMFIGCGKKQRSLPIGLDYDKKLDKFRVKCYNKDKKQVTLGLFFDKYEAFFTYKNFKEKVIREVADEYKNKIPKKLYDALYNYEVDILD